MRNLTEAEKQSFINDFPNLDVEKVLCTQEASSDYSCISFAVGVRDRWINARDVKVDSMFNDYEFTDNEDDAEIALYYNNNELSHAARKNYYYNCWESKCGGNVGILHTIEELRGDYYGDTVYFLRRKQND